MPEVVRLRQDSLEWRLAEGEVIVLDLDRSEYLVVNRAGATLWDLLARGSSPSEMSDRLAERYGVGPGGAASDVEAFLGVLAERRLLERE